MTVFTGSVPKSIFATGAVSKSISSTASMQKSLYSVAGTLFVPGVAHEFDSWLWDDGSFIMWDDGTHVGV